MLQGDAAAAGAAGPPSRVQASAAAAADEVMGVPDAFLGEWITHEQNIVESDGSKLPDVDLALTVRTCMFQPRNKEIARYLLPQLLRAEYAGDQYPAFFVKVRGKKGHEKISIWRSDPTTSGGGGRAGSFTGLDASEIQCDGSIVWVRASESAVTGNITWTRPPTPPAGGDPAAAVEPYTVTDKRTAGLKTPGGSNPTPTTSSASKRRRPAGAAGAAETTSNRVCLCGAPACAAHTDIFVEQQRDAAAALRFVCLPVGAALSTTAPDGRPDTLVDAIARKSLTDLMTRRHISTLRRARECDIDPTDSRLNSDTNQYRPVEE